eukprot:CAMPEP_0114572836 /NCGR_PEP_ID=MMETSP0114-20121206/18520_1 /TAXON_ID=31324 /ORGANISM="Goniomonas sp, Strain m" /LENGTH=66 /DNA_ID=CAMNT_0001760105 /DNA_START=192 /DNA_END=392 /DNA_ORIENTATION=+
MSFTQSLLSSETWGSTDGSGWYNTSCPTIRYPWAAAQLSKVSVFRTPPGTLTPPLPSARRCLGPYL